MDGIGAKGLKTKLIINYLPQGISDNDFRAMFSSIGPLASYRVMKDKRTGYCFGYGFVDYQNPDDAVTAIERLNGHKMGVKTLRVAYSKPAGGEKNTNLYVSGLGNNCDENKLEELFKRYGDIVQVKILRNSDNSSKGTGFVLFKDKKEADGSIRALQGYADGYGMNLQIKYAKDANEQQKSHPKYQEFLQHKMKDQPIQYPQQHALPVATPTYGQAQQLAFTPPVGNGYGLNGVYGGGGYVGNEYEGSGYGGGMMSDMGGQKAVRGRDTARFNPIARPIPTVTDSMRGSMGVVNTINVEPTILYCYNIGPNAVESDLYSLFSRFGRITKVNVINGKGYGFVHMPLRSEAYEAIRNLDGMPYKNKNLQVSIKSSKS